MNEPQFEQLLEEIRNLRKAGEELNVGIETFSAILSEINESLVGIGERITALEPYLNQS
jgi:hypothetical protein